MAYDGAMRILHSIGQPSIITLAAVLAITAVAAGRHGDAADAADAGRDRSPWDAFMADAAERFGEDGERAATFLAEHRPERDHAIDPDLLVENLKYALLARETFTWAAELDDERFLNDVLPYAVIDEPRDRWRAEMYELAREIVADAESVVDAVQALNRELFQRTSVRYSTERRRANQSITETLEFGMASCTGLSIMLVGACRSVGIPARMAGVASWPDRGGNHAWVEIWDGSGWRFTGAAEYDAGGLDRAWFNDRAASAIEGHVRHGVWATSWRSSSRHYPLAWNMDDRSVPGVDVTHRYTRDIAVDVEAAEAVHAIRLWRSRGEARLAGTIRLIDEAGETLTEAQTFADPDDINLVAELPFQPNIEHRLEIRVGFETRLAWLEPREEPADGIHELYWDELSLSKESATVWRDDLWDVRAAAVRTSGMDQLLQSQVIRAGEHELRLKWKEFGNEDRMIEPSLWISLHGGGN